MTTRHDALRYLLAATLTMSMGSSVGCGEQQTEEESVSAAQELDVYGTKQCPEGQIAWRLSSSTSNDSEEFAATDEGTDYSAVFDRTAIKIERIEGMSLPPQSSTDKWEDIDLEAFKQTFKEDIAQRCDNQGSCTFNLFMQRRRTDYYNNSSKQWSIDHDLSVVYSCGPADVDANGDQNYYTAKPHDNWDNKGKGWVSHFASAAYYPNCTDQARRLITRESRVVCAPQECHGRARRNADMQCVVDPTKEEVVVTASIGTPTPVRSPTDPLTESILSGSGEDEGLYGDGPNAIYPSKPVPSQALLRVPVTVSFAQGRVPEEVKFTAWIEEELDLLKIWDYSEGTAKDKKLKVYRCSPFGITIRKDDDDHVVGPNGEWTYTRVVEVNFSEECHAPGSYEKMIQDLARLSGTYRSDINAARQTLPNTDYNLARLHLSYDMMGRSVWHKNLTLSQPETAITDSTPECTPNPTGFFYNAEDRVYDMASYYNQRKIATAPEPIVFSDYYHSRAEIGPIDIKTRSELVLKPGSAINQPLLLDLSWYADGLHRHHIYNPEGPYTVSSPHHTEDRRYLHALRADVYILPLGANKVQIQSQAPVKLGSVALNDGRPGDGEVRASGGGVTTAVNLKITDAVKDKFITAGSGPSFSFITDETATFDLFYCINGELHDGSDAFQPLSSLGETRHVLQRRKQATGWVTSDTPYSADTTETAATQSYTIELESVAVDKVSLSTDDTLWKYRGCVVAKEPLVVYVDRYQTALEPVSPVGVDEKADEKASGDAEMSGGSDNDVAETCPNGSTKDVHCDNRTRGMNRNQGEGGNSLLDFNTVLKNTAKKAGEEFASATVEFSGELIGQYVLDVNDLTGSYREGDVPGESKSLKFTMTPDWDAIYNKLKGMEPPAANPEWKKGRYSGREGLGFAWGYKFMIKIGPIPVFVTFALTVGGGVALEVQVDFAPQDDDDAYACLDEDDDCIEIPTTTNADNSDGPPIPETFKDAAEVCYAMGGRMADFSSQAEADALHAAMVEKGANEFWIGAQTAYKWSKAACQAVCYQEILGIQFCHPTEQVCDESGTTEYRWLSNGVPFARNEGTAAPAPVTRTDDAGNTVETIYKISREGLSTSQPTYAAMFHNRATGKSQLWPHLRHAHDHSASKSHTAVCWSLQQRRHT